MTRARWPSEISTNTASSASPPNCAPSVVSCPLADQPGSALPCFAKFFCCRGNNLRPTQFGYLQHLRLQTVVLAPCHHGLRTEVNLSAQHTLCTHVSDCVFWRNAHAHAPSEEGSPLFLPFRGRGR